MSNEYEQKKSIRYALKFLSASLLGIVIFFFPIKGSHGITILIDWIVSGFLTICGTSVKWLIVFACAWGVIRDAQKKIYKKNITFAIMYIFRVLGLMLCIMYIANLGPAIIYDERIMPFLFENICRSIVLLVPIGGAFLCLLTDYGLMEFVGHFWESIMRKVWKVPGIAAVDMLTSFVGSFSIGFLLTDKMYTSGKYTYKEAMIIATGFSTVSTTFMLTLARNLDILNLWVWFFVASFIANMLVTAIVIRLWPIKLYDNEKNEQSVETNTKNIMEKVCDKVKTAMPVGGAVGNGIISGINMLGIMIPTILSVGTFGMLLVLHTKLFDGIACVFFPIIKIFFKEETFTIAKALSTTIIDTFLPVSFVVKMDVDVRFFCGTIAVTEILFLTASIPTLMATNLPVKIKDLFIIWFERMVVSIIISGALTKLLMLFI